MREKMPLSQRAKQFLPFNAVRGLRQALLAKEFEVEAVQKGILAEEEARNISSILASLQGGETLEAKYFRGGHYYFAEGKGKLVYEEGYLLIDELKISLKDLFGLRVLAR